MKFFRSPFHDLLLILLWMIVGLVLRFHNLSLKPLWADECSTLVFSLGHSFRTVPLDELISAEQLLAPLRWHSDTTALNAIQGVLTESNHPPLFFALTHWWMDGWHLWSGRLGFIFGSGSNTILDIPLGAVRSLSALCGVLAIPGTYLAAKWLWRSPTSLDQTEGSDHSSANVSVNASANISAQVSALLMALSPFGIYLAQEARHYTLTILWILGSLSCLVAVLRDWRDRRSIPLWLIVSWISLNGLGMATHYFFGLTLVAEAIVLGIGLLIFNREQGGKQEHKSQLRKNYGRLGAIILGTVVSGSIWVPFLLSIQQGDELTRWIQAPSGGVGSLFSPLLNTIASLVTMLYLLPIQGISIGVAIASGVVLVGATIVSLIIVKSWAIEMLRAPIAHLKCFIPRKCEPQEEPQPISDEALSLFILVGVVISAIAIMLGVTYVFGMDISQAFRYHYVYFPAVILVMGRGLAHLWGAGGDAGRRSPLVLGALFTLALFGGLTVTHNLAYQKVHHPDRVVQIMAERSHHPMIVAISHQSHGQTGRLMSLAWDMQRQAPVLGPASERFKTAQFFLDHQPCDKPGEQNCNTPSSALRQTLKHQKALYDLWLLNYEGQTNLTKQHCTYRKTKRVDGYKAQHYTCGRKE